MSYRCKGDTGSTRTNQWIKRGCARNHRESTLPPSWSVQLFAPQGEEPQPFESVTPSLPPYHATGAPGAALLTCVQSSDKGQSTCYSRRNSGMTCSGIGFEMGFYVRSVSFSLSSENSCMANFLWLWASFSSFAWDFSFSLASPSSWPHHEQDCWKFRFSQWLSKDHKAHRIAVLPCASRPALVLCFLSVSPAFWRV